MKYLSLILLFLTASQANAQRIYVDSASVAPNPDGSSWAMAFRNLQPALDTAKAGDSIWVAKGTYYPTVEFIPAGENSAPRYEPRYKTFYINKNGVKILGGFQGKEASFFQRNINTYATILSGDIGTMGYRPDNALRVIYIDGTSEIGDIKLETVIDGFQVADGKGFHKGGGILINGEGIGNEASPTIRNCSFMQNSAVQGGAVANIGCNHGKSSTSFVNCSFRNNKAESGGAVFNDGLGGKCSPSFFSCTFQENHGHGSGGAIFNSGNYSGNSSPFIVNCSFSINSAEDGGAIFNYGSKNGLSSPTIVNCSFHKNTAEKSGGAIYNDCIVDGESSPVIINCSFSQNSGRSRGGAIANMGYAFNGDICFPNIINCILWGNEGNYSATDFGHQISEWGNSQCSISYSLIEGIDTFTDPPTSWENNVSSDPQFVNPDSGDLRLLSTSPAINAGINHIFTAFIVTDILGNSRIQGATIDLGAFELEIPWNTDSISIDSTSIDSTSILSGFNAYPNPFIDQLTIEWEPKPSQTSRNDAFEANIYDLQGRIIRSSSLATMRNKYLLELGDLPTGVYTLQIEGWSTKIIKL